MKKLLLLILHLIMLCIASFGQDSLYTQPLKGYSLATYYASIFAHSKSVQNTSGANPIGIELLYSSQNLDEKTWQICNCFFNKGIGINYFNFDSKILGQSLSAYYVLEPQFRLNNKLKLLINSHSGLAFLNNPYHPTHNPSNMSYSTYLSAYVGLGTGLQYAFSRWQMALMGHFLHVSNGGIKDPNKGINWPSVSLRITYNPAINNLPKYTKKKWDKNHYTTLDIAGFVSSKTVATGEKERFLIWGLSALLSKQISGLNAITLGNEIFWDNALKERLSRDGIANSNARVGVILGHEFLLGKFRFSQQLGYYLFSPTSYFSKIYHRWGIKYQLTEKLNLGLSLLVHKQVANFLDFRIAYTFAIVKNK